VQRPIALSSAFSVALAAAGTVTQHTYWGQCVSSSVGCGDCVVCTSLATEQLDFLLRTYTHYTTLLPIVSAETLTALHTHTHTPTILLQYTARTHLHHTVTTLLFTASQLTLLMLAVRYMHALTLL
jgi:hypothetical protein